MLEEKAWKFAKEHIVFQRIFCQTEEFICYQGHSVNIFGGCQKFAL